MEIQVKSDMLADSYFSEGSVKHPSKTPSDDTSLYKIWIELRDNTSLHGVCRISKQKTFIHGMIWAIMTLTMFTCLTATLVEFTLAYFSYEKLINIKVEMHSEMEFPTITLCNISPINISRLPERHVFNNYYFNISQIGSFDLNLSDPYYSILHEHRNDSWLDRTGFEVRSTISDCTFAHKKCYHLMEKRVTDRGLCFSFNGPSQKSPVVSRITGNKEGLTMFVYLDQANYIPAVNMGAGLQVAIHHRDVEPNMADKSFLVSPGTVTYVQMTKKKHTYLSRPFKAFGEHYCTNTNDPDFRNPLEHYPKYSPYACIRECRSRYIYQICNCRLITDIGNETICTIAQEYQCALRQKELFDLNPKLQAACNCPQSCEDTMFQKQISFAQFPSEKFREAIAVLPLPSRNISTNYLELRLYYDSFVVHTIEQVPKVDITSIFGNIGGFLGIFLGASLLTVMEVLEAVIITVYVLLRRLIRGIKRSPDSEPQICNKITDMDTNKTSIQKFVKN